jgi:hypothetical protein
MREGAEVFSSRVLVATTPADAGPVDSQGPLSRARVLHVASAIAATCPLRTRTMRIVSTMSRATEPCCSRGVAEEIIGVLLSGHATAR